MKLRRVGGYSDMGGSRKAPLSHPLGNDAECLGGLIPPVTLNGGLGRNAASPNKAVELSAG